MTSQLREQMKKISSGEFLDEICDEEFNKLQVENMKLKHRLAVLENVNRNRFMRCFP